MPKEPAEEPNLFKEEKKKRSKGHWLLITAVIVVSSVILFYLFGHGKRVEAEGIVTAERLVTVGVNQPGVLTEVLHKEGDSVLEKDILARFQNRDLDRDIVDLEMEIDLLKSDVRMLENKIEYLEEEIAKKLLLVENRVIGKAILERVRLEIEQHKELKIKKETEILALEKKVAFLKEKRELLLVRSPFSGILLSDPRFRIGNYFTQKDSLFKIADPKTIYVKALVPEDAVDQIKTGDTVTIELEAFPGKSFQGEVSKVGVKAERAVEKVFKVRHVVPSNIRFAGIPAGVKVGMKAKTFIYPGGGKVIVSKEDFSSLILNDLNQEEVKSE
ncbi:MAG: efflux RND transporter periplasmic adaptor subunit [Candidatus Omnitrophica bacterium]|nr:efflux RND transporter periplasmic adaptor subunit [Candidatus Omnitrophota bacterium]